MEMILSLYGWLIFTVLTASSESGHSVPETAGGIGGASKAEARGPRCQLPNRWEGNWFQSGVHQTISINSSSISTKGKCLENDGEKFLLYNEKEDCYRCVVFHEKHLNVLQYKETFCIKEKGKKGLRDVCSKITGDANLFSMFRLDGVPIECPFKGPFTFTYNRGHGDCKYPVSTVDSCIHPSRQILNFQACPDVPGTESTVEELQCLGKWKEGSSRYLLGLLKYRHHASYEERFRCFVYEQSKKGGVFSSPNIQVKVVQGFIGGGAGNSSAAALTSSGGGGNEGSRQQGEGEILLRLSQSGDATCNGLSAMEGSRTMILKRAPALPKCMFPTWVQAHAQWHTLDQRSTFAFESSLLKVSNSSDLAGMTPSSLSMSGVCHQIKDNPTLDRVLLVLHVTSECQTGFICAAIYKRDGHIVEMQMGSVSRRPDDACHISYFDQTVLPYVTLVSSTPETRQCPNLGQFEVTGVRREGRDVRECEGFTTLRVGCSSLDTLQFRSGCSGNVDHAFAGLFRSEYSCHGWWEEMGVSYLITTPLSRASTGARRYCFVFRETLEASQGKLQRAFSSEEGGGSLAQNSLPEYRRILHFSSIADSCRRNISPGVEGSLAFNVTGHGRCDDTNGAIKGVSFPYLLVLLVIFMSSGLSSELLEMRALTSTSKS